MYAHNWQPLEDFLQVDTIAFGAALIVGVLFVLVVSAALVQWLTLPILRLMEGYWKWPLKGLRRRMVDGVNQKVAKQEQEWDRLADQYEPGTLDAEGTERYSTDNSLTSTRWSQTWTRRRSAISCGPPKNTPGAAMDWRS